MYISTCIFRRCLCVCVCLFVYIYIYICARKHVYIYIFIDICMYVCFAFAQLKPTVNPVELSRRICRTVSQTQHKLFWRYHVMEQGKPCLRGAGSHPWEGDATYMQPYVALHPPTTSLKEPRNPELQPLPPAINYHKHHLCRF